MSRFCFVLKWLEIAMSKCFDSVFSALVKDFWLKNAAASDMMSSDKGAPLAERSETYGAKQKDKGTENGKGMVSGDTGRTRVCQPTDHIKLGD
jgi:hypothetical protein